NKGHVNAQTYLAYYYLKGYGTPSDPVKAAYWYQVAAEKNQPDAQAELGQLYLTGNGMNKDYQQAAFWFGKSAAQGNAMGQAKLGYMYLAGIGVPQNNIKAYVWIKLAAKSKNKELLKELKSLEITLSERDKKEAEKIIKDMGALESLPLPEE
ncbi:MAG: tetratricopeptide repeat protein, partial [Legionellales bacterium]